MKNSERVISNNGDKQGVVFVIENAHLELAPIRKTTGSNENEKYELLSGSKNWNHFAMSESYDPTDFQPEIAHEAIKAVLGSPLNNSGQLEALYVKTDRDVLIEIKPHAHIPVDYDSFADLMVEVLLNSSIEGAVKGEEVLRIVENPVTRYLPPKSARIVLTHSDGYEKWADIQRHIANMRTEKPLVFVIGAMTDGTIDADDFILIDKDPGTASICMRRICEGVVFVIENADLELMLVRETTGSNKNKKYELLSGSKNWNRFDLSESYDPSDFQPEIAHEAIKAVLGSPLNKSGQLKALYVKTERDVLIEIKPHAHIPEDYDGFADLMVDLLLSSSIEGAVKGEKALRIVEKPDTRYISPKSARIGLTHSHGYEKWVDIQHHIANMSIAKPVFVIGAMADGTVNVDYADDFIFIDKDPGSAICMRRIGEGVH